MINRRQQKKLSLNLWYGVLGNSVPELYSAQNQDEEGPQWSVIVSDPKSQQHDYIRWVLIRVIVGLGRLKAESISSHNKVRWHNEFLDTASTSSKLNKKAGKSLYCVEFWGPSHFKAYGAIFQRYRNAYAKIEDNKIHIFRCKG